MAALASSGNPPPGPPPGGAGMTVDRPASGSRDPLPDPAIDPNQLSTFAKDIMKNIRVAFSAQEMMTQRKGPKSTMQQFFDKGAAEKGKMSRELSNYFRSKTFTEKRLAIEQQAAETGKMKLDPQDPPPPVSGGESSVAPEPKRKKKPGKPDAKLIPSRSRFDKTELRKRILDAQNKRRNRIVQGTVVPPGGPIKGQPIGQIPRMYRGITVD